MDGREGGSRGTDAPAETCLGLSTCRLSSQVIANGPISANLEVADPMVAMATARCVGNGVRKKQGLKNTDGTAYREWGENDVH